MANLAALRAAVFSLSAKNLTGGLKSTPPAGARVKKTIFFTWRALVRNRTLKISCLCNVLFTGLQHDTFLDSPSALDREISLKNIHTYIHTCTHKQT